MALNTTLYGTNDQVRITAIEPDGPAGVRLFSRDTSDTITVERVPVRPWLLTTEEGAGRASHGGDVHRFHGDLPLDRLVRFLNWQTYRRAVASLRADELPYYSRPVLPEQFMMEQGVTLFKGLEFDDLLRLQFDIETAGLNPREPNNRILLVVIRTNRGHEEVIEPSTDSEAELLHDLTVRIREIDPDVIEGHNIFRFDLPYLMIRARRAGVELAWGRDGSSIRRVGNERLRAGARSIPFPNIRVHGRHFLDTYHQVQRYDTLGEFQSYGLKQSVVQLGLQSDERTFMSESDLIAMSDVDPDRLREYALDDVRDVAAISEVTTLTDFFQTQMLPRSFQDVATGGPGEKINLLMARAYLSAGYALPIPKEPEAVAGGLTELRHAGVFRPTVKCDVESLYPAIMLADRIAPESDQLGVYLGLLEELTHRRLDAKREYQQTSGAERHRWNGLQASFKVLINSFYGYLGYSRGMFNDYRAADQVTRRGQQLVTIVVDELERQGAVPIEVDTDGVYFQPPGHVRGVDAEESFIGRVGEALPAGITLAHDGSYAGMISLRTKNYALVTHDGQIILKGSSLRSRRDEPILREFLTEAVNGFISGDWDRVRSEYFDIARKIIDRTLDPEQICRTESITEKTYTSRANQRLARAAQRVPEGERVQVYERVDGELALIDEYAGDENVNYLLRRLRDTAARFRPLFSDDSTFDYTFPTVTSHTDLNVLQSSQRAEQLEMFP